MLLLSKCTFSYQMQYDGHFDAIHNLLFLALFACWCETHIPRKVPESENLYEILRSRTFVEFRINTDFTASCFFGTIFIVFARLQSFYEFTRCRQHTVSTVLSLSQQSSCVSLSPKYTGKRNFMCFRNLPSGCSCS